MLGAAAHFDERAVIANKHDDHAHVMHVVGRTLHAPEAPPRVLVVGGSGFREGFLEGQWLNDALAKAGVGQWPIVNLASSSQSYAQSLAVLDVIGRPGDVALVGINHWRYITLPEEQVRQARGDPILVRSPALLAATPEVNDEPVVLMYGFALARVRDALQRSVGRWRSGEAPVAYQQCIYTPIPKQSDEAKRALVQKWIAQFRPRFLEHFDQNAAMLETLVGELTARGLRVVLLEQPLNHDVVGGQFRLEQERYRRHAAGLDNGRDVVFLNLNASFGFRNDDFHDLTHIRHDQARQQIATRLAQHPRFAALTAGETP